MKRNILVVEDYLDLRNAIAGVLSRNGCVCDCVGTTDAIAKLRDNSYEAILISPRLPVSSDPVLHFIAQHQPGELNHVVVMQNPEADVAEEAADSRMLQLTKPFSSDELMKQVRAAR